jgi:hypothetical protein
MHFENDCIATGSRNKFYHKCEHEQLKYFFSTTEFSITDLSNISLELPEYNVRTEIIT